MLRFLAAATAASSIFWAAAAPRAAEPTKQTAWQIDNLQKIGGHKLTVAGEPKVIETEHGKAVAFDGVDDALFFDVHPLAGLKEFTVEVVFRPDADGPKEQRFFHMQAEGSMDRVMFETRLPGDGQWFLDTHIQQGEGGSTLFAEEYKHPLGPWYHAALIVADGKMRHFVNGKEEMSRDIDYRPQQPGSTSLGVRINRVHWFKGAVRTIRFSDRALPPSEFLKPGA